MKHLKVNARNLDTIRELLMYTDNDIMFFSKLKQGIFDMVYDYDINYDVEREIKEHLHKIGELFDTVLKEKNK